MTNIRTLDHWERLTESSITDLEAITENLGPTICSTLGHMLNVVMEARKMEEKEDRPGQAVHGKGGRKSILGRLT